MRMSTELVKSSQGASLFGLGGGVAVSGPEGEEGVALGGLDGRVGDGLLGGGVGALWVPRAEGWVGLVGHAKWPARNRSEGGPVHAERIRRSWGAVECEAMGPVVGFGEVASG